MKYITGLVSSLIFLFFLLNRECLAGVAKKSSKVTKISKASKTTTAKPPTVALSEDQKNAWIAKYEACFNNCTKDGVKLECGENGLWFLNKCHRSCQGMAKSKSEKDCNHFEKLDFSQIWDCRIKCDGKGESRECGNDGIWYDNSCRRNCFGVPLADKKMCEKLDKVDECDIKCFDKPYKPECGVDGDFYPSNCHRECLGVKAGTEGKECRERSIVSKYWMCQDGCAGQETNEQCGEGGHWFFNACHRDCFGEKLSATGKDCKTEE